MVILKIFFAFCSLDWLRSLEKTADRLRVVLEYAIFKRLTDPSFMSYKVFSILIDFSTLGKLHIVFEIF